MRIFTVLSFLLLLLFTACQKEAKISPVVNPVVTSSPASTTAIATPKPDTIPDKAAFKLQLVKDSINNDETMFLFNHASSGNFYIAEDSPYFPGFGAENLASISNDGRDLVINSLPYRSGMSVDLDVNVKADGLYSLKLSYINKIPSNIRIWVKDAYLKDSIDVRTTAYSFKVVKTDINSYGNKRFKLILKDKGQQ